VYFAGAELVFTASEAAKILERQIQTTVARSTATSRMMLVSCSARPRLTA
jgi:hypothetical protein